MTSSKPSIRKLLPILALCSAALALSACSASTLSANRPIYLPQLNPEVAKCDRPQLLPIGPLNQYGTETYWARDRAELVDCGNKLDLLVDHYQAIAAELSLAGKRTVD